MKKVTPEMRFNHRKKVFEYRLKKFGYPPCNEIIEQLESLFEDHLLSIENEDDVFERDCLALKYAIEIIKMEVYKKWLNIYLKKILF